MAQAPQNRDLTERFIEFYRNYYREEIGTLAQQYPKEKRSLHIDYDDLYRFDSELADDYITKPGQFQEYAEEALRLFDLPADVKLGQAHVRMRNLPETVDIRNLRVNDDHIGTLISVQGIVRKATDVRPKITEAAFECQRCGTMSYIPQGDGGFQEPHECQGCERQGPFRIDFDQSNFVDSQKLRVQESPEGLRGGETPQSIDINLSDDVTGKVTAGDHVTVVGVLHIEQQTSGNEKTPVFDYYMEGISLTIEDEEFEDMEISDEDVAEIVELSNDPAIYEKMVESVAPAIYGYEQEKMAMILQLFSGVTKHLPDGSRIRGDLHMLLIGDPGTGKSQMLSYIRHIAPRSVYTSGKGSSSAGLTAAAVRDDFGDGQQWTLEAGALVLADKGIAAVDELDKMRPEDRSAMHEGLEQQQISVSKAGINATLKSRCSLLGAANPKYGRFDQYEPIGEQIDLEPALISRFDLIFTVTDDPDPDEDSKLADHILKTNYAGELNTQRTNVANSEFTEQQVDAVTDEVAPTIDADLLRKYIAYAKRTCYPTMTDEAKEVIRDFYVDFRARGADEDAPVPVTARKLEALVRLGEASARVRLSDKVTREDAERVTGIVESCLRDIGMDPETGEFDADIVETGRSKTQRDRIKNLLELIRTMQEEYEEGAPHEEVLERANSELNMDEKTVNDQLDKLKMKGDIYEPRGDVYRAT
ncbi:MULTISPECIES: minichromosome maintenance protein MCM [Haloferax]|uniref:Minichromosome maintenance protein MCM n=1 Tax=Haloferax sp. Atlit-48N TaxID=2077198 RepID=A0ACD5I042_9EURY|nr:MULTISPECIES: minichromosome maintenance protein MCM [Haloferax]MBC9985046.1 minichromosome maintenance protein MCM [Haloferax sp. AS1]RDZ30181.1 AAA family ATPase [Haloferax sp. Atlit-48N]RDZ36793.1 AAA family ATPase [Haloferax sp. Atlit-24N]RDZ41715.1 AAA family ATPase [Haloferax sp. Atlit-47N]RLM37592.1 AAA family ATPase [Haloferax sp. Atlit-109R]